MKAKQRVKAAFEVVLDAQNPIGAGCHIEILPNIVQD